ncbi:MAG: hypothetical protein HY901_11305 [Deltaproteobacteria bacterium]|nr:hypothetical protein [Deltaproteobacteria bacterium]
MAGTNGTSGTDVSAADRPSEDAMFGAPTPATADPADTPEATPARALTDDHGRATEEAMFGGGSARASDAASSAGEIVPEDPLKIGGQLYMRAASGVSTEVPASKWTFSVPTLVDGYFDARPNERVRGFVLARLSYDPTIPDGDEAAASAFGTQKQLSLALDQLWLRFDVGRALFVTAGRQHIKWGAGHFWNPTDFLHQVRRDPLSPFDARTGTTMIKVHVPWEKYGWNFYAVGLLEDLAVDGTLGKVGGGLRAEMVLGTAELGAEAIFQRGHKPRLGADLSAGVGPFDVYAEASLHKGWEQPLWRFVDKANPALGFESWMEKDYTVQATGGLNWTLDYMDINVLTFGAEYFYNSVGYDDPKLYPLLLSQGAFNPFYLGQHYVGVYGMLSTPASWHNLGIVLSNMGNLSDRSFVARLDVSVVLLTHLRLEGYTAFHYGRDGGEFRFSLDLPASPTTPAYVVPTPLAEVGIGLRVSI